MANYFLITPTKNYSFLGYYNHRRQQPDFTFSFEKESCILTMELEKLIKGSYSAEIAFAASQLYNKLKDHRKKYNDVQLFWDMIESSGNNVKRTLMNNNNLNNNKWRAESGAGTSTNTPIFYIGNLANNGKIMNPLPTVNSNVPKFNVKPNLDITGGNSFSSDDGNTHDTEFIKFVRDGLKALGMKAVITRNSYTNPETNEIDFFDNGGVDITAWYKEMEVLVRCKGSKNPITTKTVKKMENLLLKQVGKVGCIVVSSELNINQNVINMINTSKRKIILTTKSKAYFDIECHYNAIKMFKQASPAQNEIVVEDIRIEVVKGDNDDEVNIINFGQVGVKGKGNTKLNVSCKKLIQKKIDPTTQFTIGQFNAPGNTLKKNF